MAIPATKAELLAALSTEYAKLMAESADIPQHLERDTSLEGNVSVADIIAYQVGWGHLLINWYKTGKNGALPVTPAEGFKWNQLGLLAAHFYATYKDRSLHQLQEDLRLVVKEVEAIINENSQEQLYSLNVYNWTGKWPLGRWINVNTSSPYKSATAKIRKWKKQRTAPGRVHL